MFMKVGAGVDRETWGRGMDVLEVCFRELVCRLTKFRRHRHPITSVIPRECRKIYSPRIILERSGYFKIRKR
jgi:hypothetical protein